LELRLLETFIGRRGHVLTRAQLIDAAWDQGTHVSDRVVDTHVLNLRKKIEPVPGQPQFIRGVRGIGYRFDA
jgi:two-component system response regulator BaeR